MARLEQIRDAAVIHIRGAIPKQARCEAFSGELTPESVALKRLTRAGAVLVTCVGMASTAEEGSLDLRMRAQFGAFCLARNTKSAEGGESDVLPLAQTIGLLVHGASFDLAGVGPGRLLALDNCFTAEWEKEGITAWAVTWEHDIHFG